MENNNLLEKLSTILFLYNEPITISKLKDFLNDENLNDQEILESLNTLQKTLESIGLTILKRDTKTSDKVEFLISSKKEMSEIAKKIKEDEMTGELTPSSLQVLTICAYLGNSTKNEISFIRGIQSNQSIRSLSARGLIKKENEKYSLSIEAMQMLGINTVEDLPDYINIKKDFEERLKEVLEDN